MEIKVCPAADFAVASRRGARPAKSSKSSWQATNFGESLARAVVRVRDHIRRARRNALAADM